MTIFSRSTLAFLSVLLSFWATTVSAKHAANTHCNVYDLLEDCKDSLVDVTNGGDQKVEGELDKFLIDECREMSGLLVAKCLMKYLCINHGEKAVDKVRDCVSQVCPLAKRLPTKVCHK